MMAKFPINNLMYDTEKMEFIAKVEKWYPLERIFDITQYGMGHRYSCDLYRSEKGRYLLVHEIDYDREVAEAITEPEAKQLLLNSNYDAYIRLFGELEEA